MLKIAFINPPHADWSLANNFTYLLCQSHYNHKGKYADQVEWIPAPYKWDEYESYEEVYNEIKEADIIMFSSYVWNYPIIDAVAKIAKKNKKITVLGGPHIGTNEPDLLLKRWYYDYICQPTKPGEPFIEDLINQYIEGNIDPTNISWELRNHTGRIHDLGTEDYSVYEEHEDYLKEAVDYAREKRIEPFVILETTRGCPYKCVFCEWGGGIGTKIYKKDIEIVKRDILSLKRIGYRDAYLTDANFGAFFERDLSIFKFAWENKFNLTDISTVKLKSLRRRKAIVDAWFETVGTGPETHSKSQGGTDMWGQTEYISIVPTVSIQSISEEAMKVAKRIDLSTEDKLELSRYINMRCEEHGYPVPALELILAMPGSTIDDFYDEMEVLWNFKAWSSFRHDYMFLPDSDLNSKEYKEEYGIKTVEVYSDIIDEDGTDNWKSLYINKQTHFKTILSCFSFTEDEMKEMWFMNNAANFMLKEWYPTFKDNMKPQEFAKMCYNVIKDLDDFQLIKSEIDDIYNPNTPPRSIRQLNGEFRTTVIERFLNKNKIFIFDGVMKQWLI